MEALQVSVTTNACTHGGLWLLALEARLLERKGEYLHVAPFELEERLQALANRSFQETYTMLSKEVVDKLAVIPGLKNNA